MAEPKLTPEIQAELIKCIEAGMYYRLACDAVGIGNTTFYEWLKKGKLKNADPMYKNFRNAVKKARGSCAGNALEMIKAHSVKEWTAAAWLLERRYRKYYGKDAKDLREVARLIRLLGKGDAIDEINDEEKKQIA